MVTWEVDVHDIANSFAHAAVRGAGYSAGRAMEHAMQSQFGLVGIAGFFVLCVILGRQR